MTRAIELSEDIVVAVRANCSEANPTLCGPREPTYRPPLLTYMPLHYAYKPWTPIIHTLLLCAHSCIHSAMFGSEEVKICHCCVWFFLTVLFLLD